MADQSNGQILDAPVLQTNGMKRVDPGQSEEVDPTAAAAQYAALGARYRALKKHADAADSYSKACEILASHYGDLAPEVGEPLLAYGRSLLEYARSRNAVLGLQAGKPADEEDQGPEAGPTQGVSTQPQTRSAGSRIHFSGDSSDDENEDDQDASQGDGRAGDDFNLEDELENAFQALDTARVIFVKAGQAPDLSTARQSQCRKWQADALDLIGDVHTESEQFEQAVQQYKEALVIKESLPEPDTRVLAEAHLLIALAYEFVPKDGVVSAIEHAIKAQEMMQGKLASLVSCRESNTAAPRDLEEIADIEALMGELTAKVDELRTVPQASAEAEQQSAQDKALENYLQTLPHLRQGMGSGPSGLGNTAVVNDLNLLVKKKKSIPASTVSGGAGGSNLSSSSAQADPAPTATPAVGSAENGQALGVSAFNGNLGTKRKDDSINEDVATIPRISSSHESKKAKLG